MYATWIEKDQRFGFRLNEGLTRSPKKSATVC